MKVTKDILLTVGLSDAEADKWEEPLDTACSAYGIDTAQRIAMFLAQCFHESNHFRTLSENLNYSPQRLVQVFPRRFTLESAQAAVAKGKEGIAEAMYGNRKELGNVNPGDGGKFYGRGIIQLTGRANYTAFAKAVQQEEAILNDPSLLTVPMLAALSAGWFWQTNKLNQYADTDNIKECTRRINGAYLGLAEREALYNKIKAKLV